MRRTGRTVPLRAALATALGVVVPSGGAPDYWEKLAWQVRLLVLVDGAADDRAERLLAARCAMDERRIYWLTIGADGQVWRRFGGTDEAGVERTRPEASAAGDVRDPVGWSVGDKPSLVPCGRDGQEKHRGRPDSLETIWSLIDRMPMRRAEVACEPANCADRDRHIARHDRNQKIRLSGY